MGFCSYKLISRRTNKYNPDFTKIDCRVKNKATPTTVALFILSRLPIILCKLSATVSALKSVVFFYSTDQKVYAAAYRRFCLLYGQKMLPDNSNRIIGSLKEINNETVVGVALFLTRQFIFCTCIFFY